MKGSQRLPKSVREMTVEMHSRKIIWKESSGQWVVWEGLKFVFYGTILHKESFKD